ncbi:pro-resilin-like [Penaeus monodon]|uniref:pro-resilin-like n=1 Tax=Penaeus monodon TaxID=6687 RepID=UPI0018A751CD|nr:pro-resilin-like [Penaeus monodon]
MVASQTFLVMVLVSSVMGGDLHHGGGHLGGLLHGGGGGHGGHYAPVYNAPAHYAFNYGVQDAYFGTNFGHAESRDGYNTEGVYYVNLPDGRLQTVKYYVDEWGYHPEVTYSGVAHHAGGYH